MNNLLPTKENIGTYIITKYPEVIEQMGKVIKSKFLGADGKMVTVKTQLK